MCFGKKEKQAQIHIKGIKVSQKQIAAKKKVKLILCGNAAVGKTSITLRSQDGVFKKNQGPTITRAFQQKKMKCKTGEQIQLNIWDTAGEQRFKSIMPLYYRDAEIALLVFDLTDTDSFKEIDYWLSDLEEKVTKEGMLICIIGNKRDLIEKRRVSREEGELKASERANGFYHETSALTGQGIDDLFQKVIDEYAKKKV